MLFLPFVKHTALLTQECCVFNKCVFTQECWVCYCSCTQLLTLFRWSTMIVVNLTSSWHLWRLHSTSQGQRLEIHFVFASFSLRLFDRKCAFIRIWLVFFSSSYWNIGWTSDHIKYFGVNTFLFGKKKVQELPQSHLWSGVAGGQQQPAARTGQSYRTRGLLAQTHQLSREAAGPALHMCSCRSLAQFFSICFG